MVSEETAKMNEATVCVLASFNSRASASCQKNPFSLLKTATGKFRLSPNHENLARQYVSNNDIDGSFRMKLGFFQRWNSSQSSTESLLECDGLRKSVSDVFLFAFRAIVAVVPPVVGGLLFFSFFRKGLIV